MDDLDSYDDFETSSEKYKLAIIIITVCMALLGGYAIYTVFTSGIDWGFEIDWNCFHSLLFPILCVIGFFLQFFNWQHWSMETWIGTKEDRNSKTKWEKSNDITDVMFGGCLMPLLGHLLVVPLLYGALLWYSIMGLVHLVGKASPFLISALIAGLIFAFYIIGNRLSSNRYRIALLVIFTLFEGVILSGTAYYMRNHDSISLFGNSATTSKTLNSIGTCTIIGNGVNLRVGPGTNFDKSGFAVSSGESYPMLEESGDWVKIDYNGNPLWISNKFCHLTYNNASNVEDEDLGCYAGDEDDKIIYESESTSTEALDESNAMTPSNEDFEVLNPIPGANVYLGKLDGKYEIVMQIYNASDNNWEGTLYYTKYKTPIALSGKTDNGTLSLDEFTNGNLTGHFIGRISPDGFDGVWQNVDGTKTMDCTLRFLKSN